MRKAVRKLKKMDWSGQTYEDFAKKTEKLNPDVEFTKDLMDDGCSPSWTSMSSTPSTDSGHSPDEALCFESSRTKSPALKGEALNMKLPTLPSKRLPSNEPYQLGCEFQTYEGFAKKTEKWNPEENFTKESMDEAFRSAISVTIAHAGHKS
ncbi:unnamed protein product [Zymoseptoria tritici ST99CH_1A5]|nr:unnamed protein product [Zymoseptoria tritici ST99CH_1E4]SMR47481.1 unnamed protein product [Zymoseptoria tritici ST99CH_3D1]SMY21381.1 unnamed protein product [Zymoseptoria tritici ST99CH_1A5]